MMRYTVRKATHITAPCFQPPWRKRDSLSKGIAIVAVRRSETAKDSRSRFVGLRLRLLLVSIVKQTRRFPTTATTAINM